MKKFDVQIALEGVAEARTRWTAAKREFDEGVNKVMGRLLHEAAANYMSVEEVARYSGLSKLQVRSMMRLNRLDPRDGKTLLAKHAAEALSSNAELLGIAPHEMDLMSPLAYLPMGRELRQQLTDKTVQSVHELPEDKDAEIARLTRLVTYYENKYSEAWDDAPVSGNVSVSGNSIVTALTEEERHAVEEAAAMFGPTNGDLIALINMLLANRAAVSGDR